MAVENILSTPSDIYRAVQPFFPGAEVELRVELEAPAPVEMTLRLADNIRPVTIGYGVDREAFIASLSHFSKHTRMVESLSKTPVMHTLDPARFSTRVPLKNWQSFRRILYENTGKRCTDAILDYLKSLGAETKAVLASLGLSPEQLGGDFTESDLSYFIALIEQIMGLSSDTRRLVVDNFRNQYPAIFPRIKKHLVAQNLQNSGRVDHYGVFVASLRGKVVGQEPATEQLAAALAKQKSLAKGNTAPVFLFVGPTGVGKTELAKAVAMSKGTPLISFSMQQYPDETHVNTFFGSGSGYVGSTDKPHLAKALDSCNPTRNGIEQGMTVMTVSNRVLLFDEFEKAHPTIKQSLLTLFDESYFVVNYTYYGVNQSIKYCLNDCVIICTSNLYQEQIIGCCARFIPFDEIASLFKRWNIEYPLPESYSQELLGRMQIIPFRPVPRGEPYQKIIRSELDAFMKEVKKEFSIREVSLEGEAEVLSFLENQLYGRGVDIRSLHRSFQRLMPLIHRSKSEWGILEKVKIIFCVQEGRFCGKVLTFVDLLDSFESIDQVIHLLPSA